MLLKHYEKLNSDDGNNAYEVVGTASNFISKNVGHQAAVNNACNNYARQAGSIVKGRIVCDMSANSTDGDGEFEHFYAAYERLSRRCRQHVNSFTIFDERSSQTILPIPIL